MKHKRGMRAAIFGLFALLFAFLTSAELEFLGNYSQGFVLSAATYGDTLYFGSSGTLMVAQLDDHGELNIVQEIPFPTIVNTILRHDHYLFVERMFEPKIRVFDLSTPESPRVLGDIPDLRFYRSSAVAGDLLIGWYSDSNGSGIKIFDLKNGPFPLVELSSIDTPSSGFGPLGIAGTTLYYTMSGEGSTDNLVAVDLSDPTNPQWLSTLEGLPELTQIRSLGNTLYLSSWDDGLLVMDITEPTQPTLVKTVPAGWGAYLSLDGQRGVLVGNEKLITLSLSNPSDPIILQTTDLPETAGGVLLSGNDVLIPAGSNGIMVGRLDLNGDFNLSDQHQAEGTGSSSITVQNDTAYVAQLSGLGIFDVSDARNPSPISHLKLPDRAYSIALEGNLVAVSTGGFSDESTHELQFVDVSDPLQPKLVSSYPLPNFPHRIRIHEDFVYIADRESGLITLDLTNPDSPSLVSTFGGLVYDVFIQEDRAYFTDQTSRSLEVIDISTPNSPVSLTTYSPPDFLPYGIAIVQDLAYVMSYFDIKVIDFTDVHNPIQISTTEVGLIGSPTISGNILYTNSAPFFRHFDIANPTNVLEVTPFTNFYGGFFSVENFKVYLPSPFGGFFIFRDLASLTFSDGFETGDLSSWSEVQP